MIEKIVTAGISWVLGMLNPAGALVKVVQALIGVVQWIMERGAALMDFVGTVIDAVSDIANGGVGGVPAKIEAALGKAVPLVIAFLANLLGLGGISEKIKSILKAVQAPINKALDFVIKGALKLAGPLIKGIKGIGGKIKAKAKSVGAKIKAKVLGGDDSPEGKKKRLDKGLTAGVSFANRFAGKPLGEKVLRPALSIIRRRFGLGSIEPVKEGKNWAINAEVQRAKVLTKAEAQAQDEAIERLRAAINGAGGVLKFLGTMAKSQEAGEVKIAEFKKMYKASEPYKQMIKGRFRGEAPYTHEWIPTNMIPVVLDRTIENLSPQSVKKADDWVKLLA